MHAIRDVIEWNLPLRPARIHRLEDPPADDAVQPAHGEIQRRTACCEIGHVEHAAGWAAVIETQLLDIGQINPSLTLFSHLSKRILKIPEEWPIDF